jgi:hypothetical protein
MKVGYLTEVLKREAVAQNSTRSKQLISLEAQPPQPGMNEFLYT